MRTLIQTVHVAALSVWLGVLVMSAATAGIIFPLVHKMNPTLPEYQAYGGEHWLIAAGQVANKVFLAADIAQMVVGVLVVLTLVAATAMARRSAPSVWLVARWATVLLLMSLMGYSLLVLRPRMEENATQFWESAKAGRSEEAEAAHAAFNADHPTSTRVLGTMACVLVLSIGVAGVWWGKSGGCSGVGVSRGSDDVA